LFDFEIKLFKKENGRVTSLDIRKLFSITKKIATKYLKSLINKGVIQKRENRVRLESEI